VRVRLLLLVLVSAILTAAFRFLGISFNNDHFVHLTAAQQMLFGEWPTRDFIDIGRPLQIVASALAQRVMGESLFSEAVLVSAAFGIAAAATAAVVFTLTGSIAVSVVAALTEVAAFPRTYSYPKLLVAAAALALMAFFLRRPTRRRHLLLAAGAAIAFLFRHDLGLFVALGGTLAAAFAAPTEDWRQRTRRALAFAATVVVMVVPYIVYVQLNGGVWNYFATALQQNQSEAGYVWPSPFAASNLWEPQLLYVFHLLPVAALVVTMVDWRRGRRGWETRFVMCAALTGIAVNFGLIRDLLAARLPDAIVPAVVLGAWLGHRAWASQRVSIWVPSTFALLAAALAVGVLGNFAENLNRAGLTRRALGSPALIAEQFAEQSAVLHDRLADPPSRTATALYPFFLYLNRCTTEQHRLFLGGMIPEVAYLARRPFGGGGYEHYNFRSAANQRRVIERLQKQLVPFALIPSATAPELDTDLSMVAAYLRERYVQLADLPVAGEERILILIDRTLQDAPRDEDTGWPCPTRSTHSARSGQAAAAGPVDSARDKPETATERPAPRSRTSATRGAAEGPA
jgi:hypothetical protein